MSRYYSMCKDNIGRFARITTTDGKRYAGVISRVTRQSVYLSGNGRGVAGTKETKSPSAHKAKTAVGTNSRKKGQEILFFPGIIPLAAITGLTFIGASPFYGGYGYGPYGRPFGPYGYGRPFRPYGFVRPYGPYGYRPYGLRRGFW